MSDRATCVHYWLVEQPNGITSKATCKYCQAQREFHNAPDYLREGGNQWKRQGEGSWAERTRGQAEYASRQAKAESSIVDGKR